MASRDLNLANYFRPRYPLYSERQEARWDAHDPSQAQAARLFAAAAVRGAKYEATAKKSQERR